MAPMKRPASAKRPAASKKAKTVMEPGDDPFAVRRDLFKAGGLMVPNSDYAGPHCWKLTAGGFGKFEDAEPVELSYFAIRALGQLPQLCLEVAGYPYRFHVMTAPHFRDHVKSTLVFGRMPCLKTPKGSELAQSKAILRYVAKLGGLAGSTDEEAARCDMLHEMLLTEAKLDELDKLDVEAAKTMTAGDLKVVSRRETMTLDEHQKTLNALKFWDLQAKTSKTGWLLGGLADGGPEGLSYVDLCVFWALRSHEEKLVACGCADLKAFLGKVRSLPGFKRLIESGRMMPDMGDGYLYKDDEFVQSTSKE